MSEEERPAFKDNKEAPAYSDEAHPPKYVSPEEREEKRLAELREWAESKKYVTQGEAGTFNWTDWRPTVGRNREPRDEHGRTFLTPTRAEREGHVTLVSDKVGTPPGYDETHAKDGEAKRKDSEGKEGVMSKVRKSLHLGQGSGRAEGA